MSTSIPPACSSRSFSLTNQETLITGTKRDRKPENSHIEDVARKALKTLPSKETSDLQMADFLGDCLNSPQKETQKHKYSSHFVGPHFIGLIEEEEEEEEVDDNLNLSSLFKDPQGNPQDEKIYLDEYNQVSPFELDLYPLPNTTSLSQNPGTVPFNANPCEEEFEFNDLEDFDFQGPLNKASEPKSFPMEEKTVRKSTRRIYSNCNRNPDATSSKPLLNAIGNLLKINPNKPFIKLSLKQRTQIPKRISPQSRNSSLPHIINSILYHEINQCQWREVPKGGLFLTCPKTLEKWQNRIAYNKDNILQKIKAVISKSWSRQSTNPSQKDLPEIVNQNEIRRSPRIKI